MTRIHHLAFRTNDVDRLCAFYEHWFGLRMARDQRPHSVWLSLGDESVLMIERKQAIEPSPGADSLELVAFRAAGEEFMRVEAQLSAEGRLEGRTNDTLYFRDPDGRRVGVSKYPL